MSDVLETSDVYCFRGGKGCVWVCVGGCVCVTERERDCVYLNKEHVRAVERQACL